jgi:acyl carrier protein
MNLERITIQVNEAICEISGGQVSAESITGEKNLRDDLGLTSLQYIILALKLEEIFGRAIITNSNIAAITTASDLYNAVQKKINDQ